MALDFASITPRTVKASLNRYNINILKNQGLSESTGFWWLHFSFDHGLEKAIEVRLTNFKYSDRSDWTLEVVKCEFLGILSKENMASFDMADEFINTHELRRINNCVLGGQEKLLNYLEENIVPIITKKIKYTRFKPQFSFFLSHASSQKPFMRTFQAGLKFLGYNTWLDEVNMPYAADLQAALKISIESSDCLIAWITEEYMKSQYCQAELLHAKSQGKIICAFGCFQEVKKYFTGRFEFMRGLHVYNPSAISFFQILRCIDEALFNFETLPI